MSERLLHPDFVAEPYWWRWFRPQQEETPDPPASVEVAVIGGGYTGLSAAIALAKAGRSVAVFEARDFGWGASTRNGGGVSGGVNVGKKLTGGPIQYAPGERAAILQEASRALEFLEHFIRDNEIDCDWKMSGRFVGAWTPDDYERQKTLLEELNTHSDAGARMVPREAQRQELGTDLYYGGMAVDRTATVNPALLYRGMLGAARDAGAVLCARAAVTGLDKRGEGWALTTARGETVAQHVIVATNAYTGRVTERLRRRVIPIVSNIIVTEELPAETVTAAFPTGRMINDTLRLRSYYRPTPDGRRVLYGGRGSFSDADPVRNASVLHRMMVERLPVLAESKVAHSWSGQVAFTFDGMPHVGVKDGLHFALGCNGSGVAMMSYLGQHAARMVLGTAEASRFSRPLPGNALYTGKPWFVPLVGTWFRIKDKAARRRAEAA